METSDDLPDEFEVVVIGTGMVESILAAAASRAGKSVLHLDRNMYYGDVWATLGLENLQDFARAYNKTVDKDSVPTNFDSTQFQYYSFSTHFPVSNLVYKWFLPSSIPEEKKQKEEEIAISTDVSSAQTDQQPIKQDTDEITVEDTTLTEAAETIDASPDKDSVSEPLMSDDIKENSEGEKQCQQHTVKEDKMEIKRWSVELVKQQSRKFNIDLVPKVIYASGAMVELLLRSCVHRYSEFQSVNKILAYLESSLALEEVPCTKSQVFSCRTFSIIDKRILMKALNYCINFDPNNETEYDELKDQPFVEVLKCKRIPEHLVSYLLYSAAMATPRTSMYEASSRIKLFFSNVGRYGHSPFLWPLYGSGELLQAFCRLSAVYGGIYYLGRRCEGMLVSKETNKCTGVLSSLKLIKAKHVITSSYSCPSEFITAQSAVPVYISRTVLFTDRPLREKTVVNNKESIVILHMPSKDEDATVPVQILQLPSITGSCPKQLYVVHITCRQKKPGWDEVKDVIDQLFVVNSSDSSVDKSHDDCLSNQLVDSLTDVQLKDWLTKTTTQEVDAKQEAEDKPKILFAFHYNITDTEHIQLDSSKPDNLHFCHGPDASIDFDRSIKQAKEIFSAMYPDEEFLEPTPDPNEITLSDLIGEDGAESAEDKVEQDLDKAEPESQAVEQQKVDKEKGMGDSNT